MKEKDKKKPKLHMVHTKGIEKWSGQGALHPEDEASLTKFLAAVADWKEENGEYKEITDLTDVRDVKQGEEIDVGGTMEGMCPTDHAEEIEKAGGIPRLIKSLLWRPKHKVKYSRIPGEGTPDDPE